MMLSQEEIGKAIAENLRRTGMAHTIIDCGSGSCEINSVFGDKLRQDMEKTSREAIMNGEFDGTWSGNAKQDEMFSNAGRYTAYSGGHRYGSSLRETIRRDRERTKQAYQKKYGKKDDITHLCEVRILEGQK